MWPKMLLEMLPHLGRVIPMAERFLATRGAREQEEQAALNQIAENLRGELGRVAEVHAGIQRTLKDQGDQVSETAVEVTRVRLGVESIEGRLSKLESGFGASESAALRAEKAAARVAMLSIALLVVLVLVAAMLGLLLVRSH